MHCGNTLKLLRQYKKLSQRALAEKLNVKQQMISWWEKQEHLDGKDLDLLLHALNSNKKEWDRFKYLTSNR